MDLVPCHYNPYFFSFGLHILPICIYIFFLFLPNKIFIYLKKKKKKKKITLIQAWRLRGFKINEFQFYFVLNQSKNFLLAHASNYFTKIAISAIFDYVERRIYNYEFLIKLLDFKVERTLEIRFFKGTFVNLFCTFFKKS